MIKNPQNPRGPLSKLYHLGKLYALRPAIAQVVATGCWITMEIGEVRYWVGRGRNKEILKYPHADKNLKVLAEGDLEK